MRRFWRRWGLRLWLAYLVVFLVWDLVLAVTFEKWWDWALVAVMALCLASYTHTTRAIRRMRMANAIDTFDEPAAPQNVRVEQPDGAVTPVELIYGGRENGMHKWIAVTPVTGLERGAVVKADHIPAGTAIAIHNIQNMPPGWSPGGPVS